MRLDATPHAPACWVIGTVAEPVFRWSDGTVFSWVKDAYRSSRSRTSCIYEGYLALLTVILDVPSG